MKPRVAIVILQMNGTADTCECLDSLLAINYPRYNVFLADNQSSEQELAKLKGWTCSKEQPVRPPVRWFSREAFEKLSRSSIRGDDKSVTIILNNQNLGFAEGNNVILRKVLQDQSFKYVLLLNNDTVVKRDFLNELVKVMEDDKHIGAAGPAIFNYRSPQIQSCGIKINYYFGLFHYRGKNQPSDVTDTDYVTGACILFQSSVLRKVGVLPPEYFLYYEETHLCERIRRAGHRIVAVPRSVIWHKEGQTSNRVSGFKQYFSVRNRLWFIRSFSKKRHKIVFYPYFFLLVVPKIIWVLWRSGQSTQPILQGIKEGVRHPIASPYTRKYLTKHHPVHPPVFTQ